MSDMDYRVEIKVRNENILKVIEKNGYKTIGDFCRLNCIMKHVSRIGDLVNLKMSPLNAEGDFWPFIYEITDLLLCSPEDLFSEAQLTMELATNKRTVLMREAEVKMLAQTHNTAPMLEEIIDQDKVKQMVMEKLDMLTPREAKVLTLRFGLDNCGDHTLDEVSKVFGCNRERVRQIEAKALRKLRHPSRSEDLKEYLDEGYL
tara:strand:- start:30955 stop:31563 length:609 start_codon:yes stop_codon:yes gene_type:complete